MRRMPISIPVLALLLVLPLPWVGSPGRAPSPPGTAATAWAQEAEAPEVWRRARELFEQQRYQEALDVLQAAGAEAPPGVETRPWAWLRWATRLRLAAVQGDAEAARQATLALLTLSEGADDDWSARAVRELVRAGGEAAEEAQRLIPHTLEYWEGSPDVQLATAEYLDLLDAVLGSGRGWPLAAATVLRMWENLVRADADHERLHRAGARILAIGPVLLPRPVQAAGAAPDGIGLPSVEGDPSTLVRVVATDVLRLSPPDWLAADAHYRLALLAESEESYRSAVRHLKVVIDMVEAENSRAAQEARQRLSRILGSQLRLTGPALYRPGSPHELQVQWRNLAGWDLTLRRVRLEEHLRLPEGDPTHGRDLASFFVPDAGETVVLRAHADEQEIAARATDGAGSESHRPRQRELRLDPLEAGVYVATITPRALPGGEVPPPSRLVLTVTDVGLTALPIVDAETGREVLELWAVSMRSGSVLDALAIRLLQSQRDGRQARWKESRLRTDNHGLARVDGVHGGSIDWAVAFAEHDGRPLVAVLGSPWWGSSYMEREMRGFVWSDRPLYRPGETVHLQGFVRWMDHAQRQVSVPEGKRSFTFLVRAPDGQTLVERAVVLDENGSIEQGLELGHRPALGAYSVQLRSSQEERWAVFGSFHVDEYRLPEFTVDVELDRERRHVLGDTLRVDVTAAYLFGGPVAGAAEIVVTRTPVWIHWTPWKRYAWGGEALDTMGRGRLMPFWQAEQDQVLRTTVQLGEDGRATVRVPTDDRRSQGEDFSYRIEARVTDLSRREESGSTEVRVSRQELFAFLHSERAVVAPGDRAEVVLRVQDALGRGVAHQGTWTLLLSEEKNSRQEQRVLLEETVTTDGGGRSALHFVPERAGHYTVRYESRDARGSEIGAETAVWCADPRTRDIVHAGDALTLVVEQEEILGDVARVLVVSDTAGLPVHLSITHAEGTETRVLRARGTAQLLEIPVDDRHRPWFHVQALGARDFRVRQASARVVVPEAPRLLDVETFFDQEEHRPGTLAPLHVKVRDATGQPVQTLLSFAVVDGAVLALMERDLPDLVELFHGFRTRPAPHLQSGQALLGGYRWLETDDDDERLGRSEGVGADESFPGVRAPLGVQRPEMAIGDVALAMAKSTPDAPPAPAAPDVELDVGLRSDFRTTVLWRTAVQTDADGTARVEVPLSESLTTWNARVIALDSQTRVGTAEAETRARKPFLVRLNHPRVFRERDGFTLSATVHSEFEEDVEALVQLRAEGLDVEERTQRVLVPARGQVRVEWEARVPEEVAELRFERDDGGRVMRALPDEIVVSVAAEASRAEDGLRRSVTLLPFGSPLTVAASTQVGEGEGRLRFSLPGQRTPESTMATLVVSPSVLSSCVQALPYLADYPYGCTEQTLSRFVPAAAVAAVAELLDVARERIDPQLDAKIEEGLARIADMQLPSGAWGWWRQGGEDPYMTSYALVALSTARRSGVGVSAEMIARGREALRKLLPRLEQRDDDMAYALYALTCADRALDRSTAALGRDATFLRHVDSLFGGRDDLRAYARALITLVLHGLGDEDRARLVLRHLRNDVQRDDVMDTAHWGRSSGYWWRGEGAVETTAFAVQALGALEPDGELRAAAVRWLVANRRGHRWDSTRATAHAIYALVEFARARGEVSARGSLIARVSGDEIARIELDPSQLLEGPGRIEFPTARLRDGENVVDLELRGEGEPFVTLEAHTYSRDASVEPAGHWLQIRRELVRLEPRMTLGGRILQIEHPLENGAMLQSGDRLRVRLRITAHQDVEYVAIEDPRPAGVEPVERLSGWHGGLGLGGRREVRDELTGFFLSSVPEGEHELVYDLRAESPGRYHVPPARAWGMYLPDVAGHGAYDTVEIATVPEIDGRDGSGR